jgi:hypothetical protein
LFFSSNAAPIYTVAMLLCRAETRLRRYTALAAELFCVADFNLPKLPGTHHGLRTQFLSSTTTPTGWGVARFSRAHWLAPSKPTRAWEPTLLWNHFTSTPQTIGGSAPVNFNESEMIRLVRGFPESSAIIHRLPPRLARRLGRSRRSRACGETKPWHTTCTCAA